ncbi:MAG: Fe-S cluster assembly ATPase SufC [Actinomycetota bacterium]
MSTTTSQPALEIRGLRVAVEDREILKGVDLIVGRGEVHALMGPNGSGKSTLAYAVAGHPKYAVLEGSVAIDGRDALAMTVDARARAGMFLAMQYPTEIPGVSVSNFLRSSVNAVRGRQVPVREFLKELKAAMKSLEMNPAFSERNVNEGFSGGEKKRHEILQLTMLRPKIAILDETDSGLDVDALRTVSEGVERLRGPDLGILLITHYTRILRYIRPDYTHVMFDGKIVERGGPELADVLEAKGYEHLRSKVVSGDA